MEKKGGGRGRSGRAWGLEAGDSRGAGPARRGKSQGPGEAGLGEGRSWERRTGDTGAGGEEERRGKIPERG